MTQNEQNTDVICPICGGAEHDIASDKLRGGVVSPVYRCRSCQVHFLERRFFNVEKLDQEYSSDYVYKPSFGNLGGSEFDLYVKYVKHIEHLLDASKTSILDIGAGPGHFVEQVKDKVKRVEVVELHPGQAEYCRNTHGITVHEDKIENLDLKEEFDIVCMFSVLEHVPDPKSFLQTAMSFVKPGGVLCVEVPNSQDPVLSLYDVPNYPYIYFRPAHLFDFNEQSLGKLLELTGFDDFELSSGQAYSLSNHMHWALMGAGQKSTEIGYRFNFPAPIKADDEMKAELQGFFDDIDRQYRAFLKDKGYGDLLFALINKPAAGQG